jgi:4-alpha-glucanotransferase
VRLVGDVPIYVADVGADVETWPELFAHGAVAGAPPDALSASGQLWGNPLYDWPAHRAAGYRWWSERFRRTFELVDLARIDHFRGFVSYWAVPAGHKTAKRGRWQRGPGRELFDAVGDKPFIAEDLGVITPAVYRLRDELGLPGMAVLLWAFGGSRTNPHAPRNIRVRQVVYTTTHDTDTAVGWFEKLSKRKQRETGLDPDEPHWGLIELALQSRASLAIVPAQDVLGLGSDAQMNRPGTADGNWQWKLKRGQLTDELAARLRDVTVRASRDATRR